MLFKKWKILEDLAGKGEHYSLMSKKIVRNSPTRPSNSFGVLLVLLICTFWRSDHTSTSNSEERKGTGVSRSGQAAVFRSCFKGGKGGED